MDETPDWIGLLAPGNGDGGPCPSTVGGWLWYCDEHDSHGNADFEDEAHAVADAHVDFMVTATGDEECLVRIWKVEPPALSPS